MCIGECLHMSSTKQDKKEQTKKVIRSLSKEIRTIEAEIGRKFERMAKLRAKIEKLKLPSLYD